MYNYWASIFLLPKEVITSITQICRNFLWSGNSDYKKAPYIAWDHVCRPKKHGGLGIKDPEAWNQATIAKLVWAIAKDKEVLWVKWIHSKYLKGKEWWEYIPQGDVSWYWKKVCQVKDLLKEACTQPRSWELAGGEDYKVSQGYLWLRGNNDQEKKEWSYPIWDRTNIPRHSFLSWVCALNRLPTKMRLARLGVH